MANAAKEAEFARRELKKEQNQINRVRGEVSRIAKHLENKYGTRGIVDFVTEQHLIIERAGRAQDYATVAQNMVHLSRKYGIPEMQLDAALSQGVIDKDKMQELKGGM